MLTAAISILDERVITRSNALNRSEEYDRTHGGEYGEHAELELNLVKTCMAMMPASGATPEIVVNPVLHDPPAAIPATWVPWSQPEIVLSQFVPEPVATDCDTWPGHSETMLEPELVE